MIALIMVEVLLVLAGFAAVCKLTRYRDRPPWLEERDVHAWWDDRAPQVRRRG